MPHLICYDITDNNLRTRMGKKILEYGLDRINKSVYLGAIQTTPLQQLEQLLADLIRTKGGPNDSVLVISVAAQQVQEMHIYGRNDLDPDELSGRKSTLIL